jgi:hypothetical protein
MAKTTEPDIEIPETDDDPEEETEPAGEGHEHTPGYPEHKHSGDGIVYVGLEASDEALYDPDRHEQDVKDQTERSRLSARIGPRELASLSVANLTEHGGDVQVMSEPVKPGGTSLRVTHPRIDGAVRIDAYFE